MPPRRTSPQPESSLPIAICTFRQRNSVVELAGIVGRDGDVIWENGRRTVIPPKLPPATPGKRRIRNGK